MALSTTMTYHYGKCNYAECHYAECHGAVFRDKEPSRYEDRSYLEKRKELTIGSGTHITPLWVELLLSQIAELDKRVNCT